MESDKEIFKKGSTTYYWSSKFFPKKARADVFKLYSYVRVMDNYVDEQPAQPKKLELSEKLRQDLMKNDTNQSLQFKKYPSLSPDEVRVVQNIVELTKKFDFEEEWLQAFFKSMKWDAQGKKYETLDDTTTYIYGSAEVIGLMMCKILQLPKESYPAAQVQGRAMQFINFLRDIQEDNSLGRCYFPRQDLERFDLSDISRKTAILHKKHFKEFMWFELRRYEQWQKEASEGFSYIPKRQRIAINTAVAGYNWTALQIKNDPFIVFERKVKPSKKQLIFWALSDY